MCLLWSLSVWNPSWLLLCLLLQLESSQQHCVRSCSMSVEFEYMLLCPIVGLTTPRPMFFFLPIPSGGISYFSILWGFWSVFHCFDVSLTFMFLSMFLLSMNCHLVFRYLHSMSNRCCIILFKLTLSLLFACCQNIYN